MLAVLLITEGPRVGTEVRSQGSDKVGCASHPEDKSQRELSSKDKSVGLQRNQLRTDPKSVPLRS